LPAGSCPYVYSSVFDLLFCNLNACFASKLDFIFFHTKFFNMLHVFGKIFDRRKIANDKYVGESNLADLLRPISTQFSTSMASNRH
jgi:hypothetical protein